MIIERKKLLEWMRAKGTVSRSEYMDFMQGICYVSTEKTPDRLLKNLLNDGKVTRVKHGHYKATKKAA